MTGATFLDVSENLALVLLGAAVALVLWRLFSGPTLPDRIMALDLLTTLAVSIIGVLALRSGVGLLIDIALALCLVGFVSTIALARFVLARHALHEIAALPEPSVPP